jgi:peroxiredoxin
MTEQLLDNPTLRDAPPSTSSLSSRLAGIMLPEVDGREVRLGNLWSQRPVVVGFLRHYGCLFCRERVSQLLDAEPLFRAKGGSLALIGLGDRELASSFRKETGLTCPLLIDEKREAYGVARLGIGSILHFLRPSYHQSQRRALSAGHRMHTPGKNPFQLGGTFVFGPGNKDLFGHISETFGDNAPVEEVAAAIRG